VSRSKKARPAHMDFDSFPQLGYIRVHNGSSFAACPILWQEGLVPTAQAGMNRKNEQTLPEARNYAYH
jgi:hypothetical protein